MKHPLRTLTLGVLFPAALAAARAEGDPGHGKVLFQQSCAICHATGQGNQPAAGQGPLLAGVVGRRAAALPNFGYTRALQSSHIVWTAATLDSFLRAPAALVPGTNMVVAVASASDRADLVAYLATLKAVAVARASGAHAATPGDWQNDAPGVVHRVDLAALPEPPPLATTTASNGLTSSWPTQPRIRAAGPVCSRRAANSRTASTDRILP